MSLTVSVDVKHYVYLFFVCLFVFRFDGYGTSVVLCITVTIDTLNSCSLSHPLPSSPLALILVSSSSIFSSCSAPSVLPPHSSPPDASPFRLSPSSSLPPSPRPPFSPLFPSSPIHN